MNSWNETLAVTLIIASCVLMVVVRIAWQRLSRAFPALPLWRFLRRAGMPPEDAANAVSAKTLQQAELACTVCGSREECRARLEAPGAAAPPSNCPNVRLFRELGFGSSRTRT